MKSINKISVIALSCLMASLAFTGCGDSSGSDGSSGSSAPAAKTTQSAADNAGDTSEDTDTADVSENTGNPDASYTVGICQLLEHEALDTATSGFRDALKEKLKADITFIEKKGDGSDEKCAEICSDLVSQNCDLIMANATPALKAAADATDSVPIVGTSITDYATALGLSYWGGTTGKNITGTSDLAPIDQQEDMLVELFPDVQKVGVIYTSTEANSKFQTNVFETALTEDGIAFEEYAASGEGDVFDVVTKAVSECDVLYIPTDNTMAASTDVIRDIVLPAKIPVIAGEEGICKGCGVATLAISYYDIGYAAGEMAYEILVNGADPGSMEIKSASSAAKKYSESNCAEIGITVPDGYSPIS